MQQDRELGIFGANYKLAVLITIFIQIFRLAAEPFFFNQSGKDDARKIYARVMKFFVIACCFMFLVIALFLDFWKVLIASKFKEYAEGINIVPVLAMASVFLGIYYNLSIWYKLTNKNMFGAYITIAGAVITLLLNIWFIPSFGYTGAAWATFICYAFMMVVSYLQGQKHYPIPYPKKKLIAYLGIAAILYGVHELIATQLNVEWKGYHYVYYGTGLLFMVLFGILILRVESKELATIANCGQVFLSCCLIKKGISSLFFTYCCFRTMARINDHIIGQCKKFASECYQQACRNRLREDLCGRFRSEKHIA